MSEKPADFYDEHMVAADAPALLPLDMSPWLPLYEEAAGWIPVSHPVVDLGAGTGRFIEALRRHGCYADIFGFDFSKAAIAEARRYLRDANVENVKLRTQDLRSWHPSDKRAGSTSYTCLEVLEHITDDLDVVAKIPAGHQFVFSVPTYHSAAHVRAFPSPSHVWERYAPLLTFRRWSLINLDGRKAIHVLDTVRRIDSWQ